MTRLQPLQSAFGLLPVLWEDDDREPFPAMPVETITVDANLKARLAELAQQAGQEVDAFAENLLRRVADFDVHFERGVPVFPRRPDAPKLTVEDVDRLLNGPE